jgi:hypothetical protein
VRQHALEFNVLITVVLTRTVALLRQRLQERDEELQQLRDSHIADIRQLTEQYTTQCNSQTADKEARITALQESSSAALRNLKDDLNARHNTQIS